MEKALRYVSDTYIKDYQKMRIGLKNNLRVFLSSRDRKCLIIDSRDVNITKLNILQIFQEFNQSADSKIWKKYCDMNNVSFFKRSDLKYTLEYFNTYPKFPLLIVVSGANWHKSDKYLIQVLSGVKLSVKRKIILVNSVFDSLDWSALYFPLKSWIKFDDLRDTTRTNDKLIEVNQTVLTQIILDDQIDDLQSCLDILNTNNADYKKSSLLQLAVEKGHAEIMIILLKNGADISTLDSNGNSILSQACLKGQRHIAHILLQNYANVNSANIDGKTAFHIAAEIGDTKLIDLLLNYDADVNITCKLGYTPLHYAALKGNPSVIEALLKAKANVNSKALDGESALHYASRHGHLKAVEIFISYGAVINEVNALGSTPLHLAVSEGHGDVFLKLIKSGANMSIRNAAGITPAQMAQSHMMLIEYFQAIAKLCST